MSCCKSNKLGQFSFENIFDVFGAQSQQQGLALITHQVTPKTMTGLLFISIIPVVLFGVIEFAKPRN